LLKGATIWGTNVITFGLLFWEFDRGGPIRPGRRFRRRQTFSSPRTRTQRLPNRTDTRGWPTICVRLLHYTNSIAFSPTDVMPLTRRVKMMMLTESAISATTVLLVAARAVNILR
jgi:hypothetical protein